MDGCNQQLLETYLDGEADAVERRRVEEHVMACAACAREMELLKASSRMLAEYAFEDITEAELSAIHQAVDDVQTQRVWRLGGALGLVAASVLIVGLAWLSEIPAPARLRSQMTVSTPAWQRTAVTLRAEPLWVAPAAPSTGDQRIQVAEAQSADSELVDWMLEGLTLQRPTP